MIFTMKDSTQEAQVIEVAVGSHVYLSEGAQYREWEELTPEQQKALIEVNKLLDECFNQSMVSSVGLVKEHGIRETAA